MTHLVLRSGLFGDSLRVMIDLLESSPKLESLSFEEVRFYWFISSPLGGLNLIVQARGEPRKGLYKENNISLILQ